METDSNFVDMHSCRICLSTSKTLCPLFRYKLSGNYAEMLTAIADVKVSSNDGLPERICSKCCTTLEKAYLLKTVAERTDRKLRKLLAKSKGNVATKKIAFDSFTDIKSEIGTISVKLEPKWDVEVNIDPDTKKPIETVDGKDIVIANTVIRKVDSAIDQLKLENVGEDNKAQITWKKREPLDDDDDDYIDDAFRDDDDDDDYVPPMEKPKPKTSFKKPKLADIKVFKDKPIVRKIKVIKRFRADDGSNSSGHKSTNITCYPILKNGTRGSPIILKRPKDSTMLKVHASYKPRQSTSLDGTRIMHRDKPVRMVKTTTPKQKEKLVCPVCGILTHTLGNHMSTHQEKKRFACPQCPRTFAQKTNLQTHVKQHTGIKDHICEVCGSGFYSQKSLVRHKLIHRGERPFSCNLCSKRFIARCDLNRHLKIHSGYKPYKCSTCTMSFNAKHQLQNHERMHTGERPYTCQMQSLRRHMRIHTGDKPFKCDICDKSFVQNHHLQNHKLTHTGDKPFSCEVCNVAFSYKVNLNNHVFKAHGVNLKFKSIHTVTEEILRRELGLMTEANIAITHIIPQVSEVPAAAAHETVHTPEY